MKSKIVKPSQEQIKAFSDEMKDVNWNNPEERRAIALLILEFVEHEVERFDLEDLLVDVTTFNIGETPQWISRKGLKAYVHEPGSYAPRSFITNKVLTITTEQISVHPEFELNQLRAGRYGTVTDITQMAADELLNRKYSIIWSTMLNSIVSTDENYASFASGASAATKKTALDTALAFVNDRAVGGAKAIVGRYTTVDWLNDVDGFADNTKEIIQNNGVLGWYRGIPIIRLKQYTDGYGNKWITDNEMLVLGGGSGRLGRNQGLESMEDINIDDKMWHVRIDEQYGVVCHYPQWNYRLHIS